VVAAAPLLAAGTDAVARLLVPPEDLGDLEVDVTDRPGEPRPCSRARAVVAAVATGQAAARAERLCQPAAAEARWVDCALGWRVAGSPEQAARAEEHADRGSARAQERGGTIDPLLADHLIDAADGRTQRWRRSTA
jgi:hypothetical protein